MHGGLVIPLCSLGAEGVPKPRCRDAVSGRQGVAEAGEMLSYLVMMPCLLFSLFVVLMSKIMRH